MQEMAITDVERVIALLNRACDPTVSITPLDRRRLVAEEVAKFVETDIWIWSTACINSKNAGDAMTVRFLDGGWQNEDERTTFYGLLTSPEVCRAQHRVADVMHSKQPQTFLRQDFISPAIWDSIKAAWNGAGFGHFIICIYPLNADFASGIAFHRRFGRPDFCERQRMIVQTVFHQVDWLHRDGCDVPAGASVLQLSPRERQVLICLLSGNSRKEIAKKLDLSEHTINDYVKQIHTHFNVNSRSELLSLFISGSQVRL
jgi:DNA-binding CsgD family transcriptional regulator